nr:hypothetical protein [Tanacetum cinerariifolium]
MLSFIRLWTLYREARSSMVSLSHSGLKGHGWEWRGSGSFTHDSPLLGGYTSNRAEGSLNLDALYALFTNLLDKVFALEIIKDAQAKEILKLKAKIKKLERRYTLIKLKDDKAKGVAFKDSKSTDRPARSILTLKPLLKINPKDKRKSVLEEPKSAKKMTKSDFDAAQIVRDEEIARQLEVELQAELERESQMDSRRTGEVHYGWKSKVERRKKQLAEERATAIKNKPPTKTQLRRLMMTYLKNMDFVPIGSKEDERMIRDLNKKSKEESNDKGVDNIKKRKEGSRMKRIQKEKCLEEPKSAKKMTKSDFDAAQIARDEEIARQLEVELQAELERERWREEQASMDYIANLYDEVQARIDVDHELAIRWTHEEHEKYNVDERAKLLAEYFKRRKKQLAKERVVAIKNKPPTKTQLRRLMMTYLKTWKEYIIGFLDLMETQDGLKPFLKW